MTAIPFGTTSGTFSDTSTNAEGQTVPDTYTFTSDLDPSLGTVSPDGTATFSAGITATFTVTATDPSGLSGSDTFEIADLVPTAVGAPVFSPA